MKYYRDLKPKIYKYMGSETTAASKKLGLEGPHELTLEIQRMWDMTVQLRAKQEYNNSTLISHFRPGPVLMLYVYELL